MMKNNVGHTCRHVIFRLHRPFTVKAFDQHWLLVQPSTRKADTETVRYDAVNYDTVLKVLLERYVNADRHQQRILYDNSIAAPDSAERDPVLVTTRGRRTRSIHRNFFTINMQKLN